MKIVIIGGVAGGASTAARLRRMDEYAEIVLLERGPYVSFANCGLPYHIGGVIAYRERLLVQTPESLRRRFRIAKRTMVLLERDIVSAAQRRKAVGPVSRVETPHRRTSTQLRITERPADPAKFGGNESVVELNIVGDEYGILHERFQFLGYVTKIRRVLDHGR